MLLWCISNPKYTINLLLSFLKDNVKNKWGGSKIEDVGKKKEESKCEKIDIPPVVDSAILQRFVGT